MISNQKESTRTLLTFSGIWAGLVIIFALSFLELFPSPIWMRIVLACIIGLAALFFYLGGYHYIQLEVKDNKDLMVKYYNLFPVGRKFRAFQIPIKNLHHHEVKYGAGGFTSWLIIFQRMQGGLAKYPAVGLSAMSNKGRQEMIKYLSKLENKQ
ncbi:hypothetical protein [Marinilabilia rubra]|uniref:DUF304 domain-containing protein n=1 Tax=Marinilabilia rubra TaxID=2162893 RepID=A0A2U2BA78_9BACT|nr:hypothetical protein [Marinilabilia rubra]PWD99954.1 hypothetical protein DDZ16_08695 [Marinilabilia rubra]